MVRPDEDPDGADAPEENPFGPNASQPKPQYEGTSTAVFWAYGGVILHTLVRDEVDEMVDPACAW